MLRAACPSNVTDSHRSARTGDFEFDSDDDVDSEDSDDVDEFGREDDAAEGAVVDTSGAMINTGQVYW